MATFAQGMFMEKSWLGFLK